MATVLVIEDTDDIRNMVATALKLKKYNVITAKNGNEGVRVAQEHQPDLIICDIMMPLLNGYEVFKRLQDIDILPRTPFIFATALDRPSDVRYAFVMGADDYIVKPFDINELLDIVQEVLKRQEDIEALEEPEKIENDIFISYSHLDTEHMHQLRQALQDAGFRVWSDEEIEPSRDWAEALAEMITFSHCVVCMLSENASESKWVGRELGYAEANDTRIFPVVVEGETRHSIPLRLINHQFIDAREDYDHAMNRLVDSIRDFLSESV